MNLRNKGHQFIITITIKKKRERKIKVSVKIYNKYQIKICACLLLIQSKYYFSPLTYKKALELWSEFAQE